MLELGHSVTIVDNLNEYYDASLKYSRLANLAKFKNLLVENSDISKDTDFIEILDRMKIQVVYHLAAQAGVRYSFENPNEYFDSNVVGTARLLDAIHKVGVSRFIFSSTSSIYGESNLPPFDENMQPSPIQYYALTKKINEEQISFYANNFIENHVVVFRFFTVYGPWGRPDMALFKFVRNMLSGKAIDVYNQGDHSRSFTYIDDVIHYLVKSMEVKLTNPIEIFNLGNAESRSLLDLIEICSKILQVNPIIKNLPKQKGDIGNTRPNISKLNLFFGSYKFTPLEVGILEFIEWYKNYKLN